MTNPTSCVGFDLVPVYEAVMETTQFQMYKNLWDEFIIDSFKVTVTRNGIATLRDVREDVDALDKNQARVCTFLERNANYQELVNQIEDPGAKIDFIRNYSSSKDRVIKWSPYTTIMSQYYKATTTMEKSVWNNTVHSIDQVAQERTVLQCCPILGWLAEIPEEWNNSIVPLCVKI